MREPIIIIIKKRTCQFSLAFSAYLDHIWFLKEHDDTWIDDKPYLASSDVRKLRLRYSKVLRTTSKERKGKERKSIYIAPFIYYVFQCTQAWITQFLPADTPCLPFLRKRSPDGTTSNWDKRHPIAAYYLSIDPERMKGWVGLVSWPIADGLPT